MMIKKIRRSTFETNSSSTHSFAIPKHSEGLIHNFFDKETIKAGEYVVTDISGQYGWGYDVFTSKFDILDYLLTYAIMANCSGVDDEEDLNKLYDSDEFINIFNIIFEVTGVKLKVSPKIFEQYDEYYIDHQSMGMQQKIIFNEIYLKKVLFDPNVSLIISNDNGTDIPENFEENFEENYIVIY